MEEMEVITGYHATINYAAVGYPISAVKEVTYPSSHAQRMYSFAGKIPEAIECCHFDRELLDGSPRCRQGRFNISEH
jgi:DNA-binding Lrp family transcriptional regulator